MPNTPRRRLERLLPGALTFEIKWGLLECFLARGWLFWGIQRFSQRTLHGTHLNAAGIDKTVTLIVAIVVGASVGRRIWIMNAFI